eukprot:755053-Hanusia_phi.AAC.1
MSFMNQLQVLPCDITMQVVTGEVQQFYFESTLQAAVFRNVVAQDFEEQVSNTTLPPHVCQDEDESCRGWAAEVVRLDSGFNEESSCARDAGGAAPSALGQASSSTWLIRSISIHGCTRGSGEQTF